MANDTHSLSWLTRSRDSTIISFRFNVISDAIDRRHNDNEHFSCARWNISSHRVSLVLSQSVDNVNNLWSGGGVSLCIDRIVEHSVHFFLLSLSLSRAQRPRCVLSFSHFHTFRKSMCFSRHRTTNDPFSKRNSIVSLRRVAISLVVALDKKSEIFTWDFTISNYCWNGRRI